MKSTTCRRALISILFGLSPFFLLPQSWAQVSFTQQQAAVLGSNVNYDSRSASLADYDNDGDLDLLFQGAGGSSSHARQLFRNNFIGSGTLTFTNVTNTLLPTGMNALTDSWSAAWGDYDSDGRVDVFVGQTNSGVSGTVLKNNPAGFANTSAATNLDDIGFHQSVAWSDIDSDNDLDLLIAMEGPTEKHEIYRQDPGGTFTPVGNTAGFQAPAGIKAYGMAIGDTDGDGDMDVYISTCRGDNNIRNNFFENRLVETGSLSFVDIAGDYTGDVTTGNGTQFTTNSYGAEFHDFNNDGKLDLFMVGADGQPSKIFRNLGDNQFRDVDLDTGHSLLSEVGGDYNGGRAVDYDNDGDLDLFFHDNHSRAGKNFARKLFRNNGGWEFEDVTLTAGLHTTTQGAYDSAWGDLDRDGDLDLVAATNSSWNERVFISNASTNGNHWLQIDLTGPQGNTTGIGTAIYATINNGTDEKKTLRRDANANAGAFNQNDIPVHFGLGDATLIDQLRIHWPDGTEQYLFDVPVNQYMTIAYAGVQPGDLNRDGIVDAADYVFWRKGFNDMFTQTDFNLWRGHFGQTPGSGGSAGSANVPEPANAFVLFALAAIFLRQRRMQRD